MAALQAILSSFENIEKDIETFLCYDEEHGARILSLLQKMFDYNKKEENISGRIVDGCPFDSLEIEDFVHEQLWQQIQLQNESYLTKSSTKFSGLLKKQDTVRLSDDIKLEMVEEIQEKLGNTTKRLCEAVCEVEDDVDDGEVDLDYDENLSDLNRDRKSKNDNKWKGSVVDDNFFKLAEMKQFLEMEEKREEVNRKNGPKNDDNDSDDIDLFTDYNNGYVEDKDGIELVSRKNDVEKKDPASYMYKDFFNVTDEAAASDTNDGDFSEDDQVTFSSINKIDLVESDNSETETNHCVPIDNDTNKSTFQKRQDKVKQKIAKLEDSNVSTKPWQLTGEASASTRPTNSLLQEMLDFDHTTATAPVITEETSQLLEDIIKQRVKDQTWDDVERKEKPVKEPYEYKKVQPLNQEKSKMSLSEVYEKEYLKQKEPAAKKENEEHAEIQKMMKSLCAKLDALSNFHFTPKPPKSEVTIVANVPSISVEETTPMNVSETTLLAPEEVYDKPKIEMKGASELTQTDRKHARRTSKKRKRLAAKNKEKMSLESGLGNKYSKTKNVEKKLKRGKNNISLEGKSEAKKSLSSSSAFFTKLQDTLRDEIQEKKSGAQKKSAKQVLATQVKL